MQPPLQPLRLPNAAPLPPACRPAAGFIGSEEFSLWRSGGLVALNAFGGMLLALLALPAVLDHVEGAGGGSKGAPTRTQPATRGGQRGKTAAGANGVGLHRALLVAGLVRAVPAFCATLSAGVQRRHLYAWALFAPKFAFEACFLLLADLALLALALLP